MKEMGRSLAWIIPFVLAAACSGGGSPSPSPAPAPGALKTVLRVDNATYSNLSIYVLRDNQRHRLGRSTANTTTHFVIPPSFVTSRRSLRFITDPVGPGREVISQDVMVVPGDTVFMRLGPF